MTHYRFTGRIASFLRATGNSWASARTVNETTGAGLIATNKELVQLYGHSHLERRGKRGSYEYRWNPETLYLEAVRAK